MGLLFRPSTDEGQYVIASGLKLQPLAGSRHLSSKSELIRMEWAERLEKGSEGDFDQAWDHQERQRGNWNCALPYPLCPFSPHLWRSSHCFLDNYCPVHNVCFIWFLKIASCPLCVPQQGTRARLRTDRRRLPPAISASSGPSVTWMQRMYGESKKV